MLAVSPVLCLSLIAGHLKACCGGSAEGAGGCSCWAEVWEVPTTALFQKLPETVVQGQHLSCSAPMMRPELCPPQHAAPGLPRRSQKALGRCSLALEGAAQVLGVSALAALQRGQRLDDA